MQVNDRFFLPNVNLVDPSSDVRQRDFIGSLFKSGKEKCTEYLGDLNKEDMKYCRNEMMVATSCVLLYKVNNHVGDLRDNVGLCAEEIKLANRYLKERFENFPDKKFEDYLRNLSISTKSFV
jgi:hypothetical protein